MQLYAAACVDCGTSPSNYRNARLDAISGALLACVISITIIIATGATIGGRGPLDSGKEAAHALRPVAGSGAERSVSRRFAEAPLFLGLFTFQIVLGAAVALTPVNLISLIIGTQVLQGIVTPVFLVYILILSNRKDVLGDVANGPAFRTAVAVAVAVAAISLMSLLLLGQTTLSWFRLG